MVRIQKKFELITIIDLMSFRKNFGKIKSFIEKYWEIPTTAVGIIILIATLIQSWETFVKYFPNVSLWVTSNAIILLVISVFILGISTLALFYYSEHFKKKYLEISKSQKTNKIVLFLSPSSGGGGDFYQEHFSHLVKSASRSANNRLNIHITLVCPSKDFGNEDPENMLHVAENYPAQVSGVFMIPSHPDKATNIESLLKFKQKFPAIILIDVFPIDNSKKELVNELNFIGGNENIGGNLAGQLALRWLKHTSEKDQYKILILKGRSTKWEMQRVNSFKKVLVEDDYLSNDELLFVQTDDLHYEIKRAKRELESRINNGEDIREYDLIFACNDEMAIGAMEVLQNLINNGIYKLSEMPKIIGYDGIPEMKRLLMIRNKLILGTVDVDIEEQASLAISIMTKLLNGIQPPENHNLLRPTIRTNKTLI